MSVHAGTIVTVAGNNVVDRIQSAGLGDVRVPVDTIREVGNELVVDKVTQEPDFTFTMESLDVSTDLMAWLTGKVGSVASASAPGSSDPTGTEYKWEDCTRFLNIVSPWKDHATGSAGTVAAAHLIPGYYPRRYRFRAGVTDNATEEVELGGGSFYYGKFGAREEQSNGTGAQTAFATANPAIRFRKGGATGTTFKSVFGVIVDGVLQVEDTDYTVSGGAAGPGGSTATITFTVAPPTGTQNVRFCYFTPTATSYPQATHASTVTKPGAVRGRHICVKLGAPAVKLANTQAFELEATVDGEIEREFCNEDMVGFTVNGTDCNGSVTVRSKDYLAFFATLKKVTGVDADTEVVGWLNENTVPLTVEIQDPKNPATIIKTLYVADAKFQVPGTPARVNTPTDFAISWESVNGTFSSYKGAKP